MDLFQTLIGVFLGGLLSIVTTLLTEYFKIPKLSIVIRENIPMRIYGKDKPAQQAKFLQVQLWNKPPNKIQRLINKWVKLKAAMHCHGEIQFYHRDDGSPVFQNPMRLRWAGAEDHVFHQTSDGKLVEVWDVSKISSSYWRTCYPEKVETIDVAVRFDNDTQCYGWTTESMLNNPLWRKPHLRLSSGRYLVKIIIRTELKEISEVFKLENTSSIENFRLLVASKEDRNKIKE